MESLMDLVQSVSADPATQQMLVIVVAAAAVFIFTLGVAYLFLGTVDPARRRLGEIGSGNGATGGGPGENQLKARKAVNIETMLGPVAAYVLPKEEIERNKITKKLVYAGYRSPNAMQNFYLAKVALAIAAPVLVYVVTRFLPNLPGSSVTMYMIVAAAAGLLLPNIVLDKLMEKRLRKLRHGFPDALDLMVVCVEAGLGLNQTLQRVADELMVSHPELAMELALVNSEMRAGVDSVSALKSLADRTGLEDIRGLVSLLVQTIKFGTSVADSLRVYSEEFRDKRMQKAEEMAAKIGTKMIFPLIVFMFPGFFVVAIGPAVIALMKVFADFPS